MLKKEINTKLKQIKELLLKGEDFNASVLYQELADNLYSDKQYYNLVEIYKKLKKLTDDPTILYTFETAYSFAEIDQEDEAERIYEHLLASNPDNSAILNNLSNIKKRKRKFKEAFNLISDAYQIEPDDDVISSNYDSLSQLISEQKEKEEKFKSALTFLQRENQFVISKLQSFIQNAKKDKDYDNGQMPIAKWKFKVFMKTDEQKAESLRQQWLDKYYLIETGQRDSHYVVIYEINPLLEKAIKEIKFKTINEDWIKGIENLNIETLEKIHYYRNLKKIGKVKKKFKDILKRDFDELTFNYLVKSHKATIILSGSLIETLLIYYLEKQKVSKVEYEINSKKVSKNLYESTLNDLLIYLEQKKLLQKQFVHLGNISRIFRNFVHPGKELRETNELDNSKADLCYISASELINTII